MAWVKAGALAAGDAVRGERSPLGATQYHHPYLVLAKTAQQLRMRNCTSHTSASFTTIEILSADKSGEPYWNNGKSGFLVTNSDEAVVATSVATGYGFDGTIDVQVPVGPPQLYQFVDEYGAPFYDYAQPTRLVTQPRVVQLFSDVEFERVGAVTAEKLKAILAALG